MLRFFILASLMTASSLSLLGQPGNPSGKAEEKIRRYWFVLLTRGEQRLQDSATAARIQAGHMANIGKLYYDGKIKVAGPFGEAGDSLTNGWQGIFIFDCETKEEVTALLQSDPAITSGRLAYHIRPWYTAPVGSFLPGKPQGK